MSTTIWEDIKKSVKQGFTVAAEKTEEYTKIGKLKVDILNVNRSLDKAFTELGREIYELAKSGKKIDVTKNEKIQGGIAKIDEQKDVLKAKEAEIETIKQEAAHEEKVVVESDIAETAETTETKKSNKKKM